LRMLLLLLCVMGHTQHLQQQQQERAKLSALLCCVAYYVSCPFITTWCQISSPQYPINSLIKLCVCCRQHRQHLHGGQAGPPPHCVHLPGGCLRGSAGVCCCACGPGVVRGGCMRLQRDQRGRLERTGPAVCRAVSHRGMGLLRAVRSCPPFQCLSQSVPLFFSFPTELQVALHHIATCWASSSAEAVVCVGGWNAMDLLSAELFPTEVPCALHHVFPVLF
jgi:hypothetical protein